MRLFRRRRSAPELPAYADDGTLPVLVEAFDAARADSDVLRDVPLPGPVLVRHHLVLPAGSVARAAELLGQDGYRLTVGDGDPAEVRAWRTQVLTPLSAAQERSRMAGLAQRLGGDVRGWDACGDLDRCPGCP